MNTIESIAQRIETSSTVRELQRVRILTTVTLVYKYESEAEQTFFESDHTTHGLMLTDRLHQSPLMRNLNVDVFFDEDDYTITITKSD